MIIHVANPIYDVVFKYLMEDERIARILLSALLKQDVVAVEMRPHEYSNTNGARRGISMFRIDFSARVREASGAERTVVIELQKTWLPTETLRFRQYLGVQYGNSGNMQDKSTAYPMYAVYLLGHCVGDIKAPVFYVHHNVTDYDGHEVTEGVPDRFVESLTHDSIFVQIPLLHGRVNNKLDRVLSIFDQQMVNDLDQHVIDVDDDAFKGDAEMEYVLRRLTMAATNPDMRLDMNVEDEYYKAIEDLDTGILERDKLLAKKDAQLNEKDAQLNEKNAQLNQQAEQIKKMAKAMQAAGMTIADIAKATAMTEADVEGLI